MLSECHCCKSSSSPAPHSFSSAPLQPCDHLCGFLPFAVAGRSHPSISALTVMVMPFLESPHCSPGSTDIVLLPVSSNSSGLLGPVRKAFLHKAPQVPANGSLRRRCHVMVCSQCPTPTTAHFLEGKYIQRAWMFLFLNLSGRKREAKQPILKQCLNITQSMCVIIPTQCRAQVNKNVLSFVGLEWLMGFKKQHKCMYTYTGFTYVHMHSGSLTCAHVHTQINSVIFSQDSYPHIHESWYIALMPVGPSGLSLFHSALITPFP